MMQFDKTYDLVVMIEYMALTKTYKHAGSKQARHAPNKKCCVGLDTL